MYTKTVYVIIDCLAIIDLFFTLRANRGIRASYAKKLASAMIASVIAILANILIALSSDVVLAEFSYCTYFAAIDWIIFFLCGFCMDYTEHHGIVKKVAVPAAVIMVLDSLSLFLNPIFRHHFYIYENIRPSGVLFYQTGFYPMYYVHLAIDYAAIIFALFFIILRIFKSYSFYRIKYLIILLVLLLVIGLNIAYMALSLVLDASVVFYAVAGTLIYFCIKIFVPKSLMNVSIARAVDDMNEGLVLFDISSQCIYANSFSKQHFFIDKADCDLSTEPMATVIDRLKEQGEPFGEIAYDANGKHYNIRYNKLPDKKGRMLGSYFLIEDATEEVYYLNEIKEAKIEADRANHAKSSFLASMSHEIRTPLNSVLGMNEMIMRSTDDPQLLEYAESIRLSGDTLLSLINDILDFSKIEANKMELVLTRYNPHDILRNCFFYFENAAMSKDLYIRISCDENMPSALFGDENRIGQILSNIVSNAVKYTASGGVTIEMNAEMTGENTALLQLTVTDTGIGIAKEDMAHLFDAFRRVNETKTANIQGTGLGLTITRELISLMQGNITVESEPGKGTCFKISIPQSVADKSPLGPFEKRIATESKPVYQQRFIAPSAKILVVDDVPLNLKLVSALLRKTQIQVDQADGGTRAIELCMNNTYDVILLDHRMPDPDGIAVFNAIRAEGANTETPVIMLTANALTGAEDEYKDLGFSSYLSKPVQGERLESELLAFLPKDKVEYL